jgi:hypothetical protein
MTTKKHRQVVVPLLSPDPAKDKMHLGKLAGTSFAWLAHVRGLNIPPPQLASTPW